MRSADTTRHPPAWSDADLVALTLRFANDPTSVRAPAIVELPTARVRAPVGVDPLTARLRASGTAVPLSTPVRAPSTAGPVTGRVADPAEGVLRPSTAPNLASTPAAAPTPAATPTPAPDPNDAAWSIPLLVAPEVEAWLLGWPAGLVTAAHGHGRAAMAVTVVEGGLSEECLDPTIWTTSRRTTWRAGASTLFPAGHVHVLGAAGDQPAVAVHAWSRVTWSGGGDAGGLAPGAAAAAGRSLGGGRGRAESVGVGPGRGRHHCLAGHPAHGALDLGHVRDRVAR
jgi:hypothetical protein